MHRTLYPRIINTSYYINYETYTPKSIQKYKGSYAVTSLRCNFKNPQCKENYMDEFLEDFSAASSKFYNLKVLDLRVPYVILDGYMLQTILRNSSTMTDLDLEVFAFHTPLENTWQYSKLKKLHVTFSDGIAFPNSGSDMLSCIEYAPNLKELWIENNSPHVPPLKVHRKIKNKTLVIGFKDVNSHWW